ncbi:MAG: phage portal protein [Novosphingobium sp.]
MSFLQSLADAFKGTGPVERAPLGRTFVSPWLFPDACTPAGRTFNYDAAIRASYLQNPVAQRAVRLVAEGVGGAPLAATTDPALTALVNATSAGQPLLETLAAQLLLHGNGYVHILKDARGRPVELFALRPERVRVIPGSSGWPAGYRYQVGDKAMTLEATDDLGRPNIVHLKFFHPSDDHYGAGCLDAADEAVAIHNAAAAWNRSLLENAARPSGALVYDPGEPGAVLAPDQFERLKAELAAAYAGAGNAGRPMLLEGGLKWQSLALSPADMDFAALKAAAARDIALAFGVPPMLLGLPGDNTYANYREANRALWRLTLLPLAGKILSGLAEGLGPWWPEATLAIDLDRVPALAEDRERLWSQVSAAEFLSEDEKRALLGLPPAPSARADAENKP